MVKLGPKYYNCNERQSSCDGKRADPRNGCPTCEFTIQYKTFIHDLENDLRLLKRGTRRGALRWPMKYLIKVVVDTATISNLHSETRGPDWSVVTSTLVSIYRDEVAKKSAIERFNATPAPDTSRSGPMLTARD